MERWPDLEAIGRFTRFRAGEALLIEGARSTRVVLIRTGRVKVSVVTPSGTELVLAVKGPGELVGEMSALDGRPGSAAAHALEEVEASAITRDAFLAWLASHPEASLQLLRSLAAVVRESDESTADRAEGSVTNRVARRVFSLAQQYGALNGPSIAIPLPLSQDDLAAWVGATRESVNRALKELRVSGALQTGRRRLVIVDVDALQRWVIDRSTTDV